MRIRTITAGISPDEIWGESGFDTACNLLHTAKEKLLDLGLEVQTLRISTDLWNTFSGEELLPMVRELERGARKSKMDFVSIGPARDPEQISMVPGIIEGSSVTCMSALVATKEEGVMTQNVLSAARAVREISEISRDGSKNFMFSSIASCPRDIPFFPAAYHPDGPVSITVGMENGDLVMRASERASGLRESGKMLTHLLEEEVNEIYGSLAAVEGFQGVDLSLAPGLEPEGSIGLAVENMTGSRFGSCGTLSACSELTRSIRDTGLERIGYSGLMLPVLEDEGLARGADERTFTVQDLLLYSSVCGTGLDAVPLPGDTPVKDLASTILDMASLSCKWDKPLSARLLPIPEKAEGEMTDLCSPYLRDCSILSV